LFRRRWQDPNEFGASRGLNIAPQPLSAPTVFGETYFCIAGYSAMIGIIERVKRRRPVNVCALAKKKYCVNEYPAFVFLQQEHRRIEVVPVWRELRKNEVR
jgi:hypothetical protein